jgi:hypothetical protein
MREIAQLSNSDAAADHREGSNRCFIPPPPFALHVHPIGRSLRRSMLIDARQKENGPKSSLHTTVCFGDAMTCAE